MKGRKKIVNRKQWSKFQYKCELPPLTHELDMQNFILMLKEKKMDMKREIWVRGRTLRLISRSSCPEVFASFPHDENHT